MEVEQAQHSRTPGWAQRFILLACVALTYGSQFWPNRLILDYGLEALGNPAYQGFEGVFLPHLLLYSTFPAIIAALLWFALVRAKILPPIGFGNVGQSIKVGVAAGLVAVGLALLLVWWMFPAGSIGWVDPSPWKIAGNLFSNFYEEFIFRGFILVALTAIFGFWPAAIVSSAMWAATHTQYPLSLQITIALTGVLFCLAVRWCKSLLPAYIGHMVLDVIGDSLIG